MRRTSVVLVVLICGVTGCRGSEAQLPYDGPVDVATHPTEAVAASAPQARSSEPIVSEPHAPWAIALLSDAPERPAKRSGKVVVVQADPEPEVAPALAQDADVHLALDPEPVDATAANEKTAAPKSCGGVVNRRS